MAILLTDSNLLAIQAQLAPLQDKLNAQGSPLAPFCYPALELSKTWTEQADSPGDHGACILTPGTPTSPMRIAFTPAKRPQGQPWDNVYVLHRNSYQAATMFAYLTSVTFPTQQDIANCNAYEQDFQMNSGATIWNWGWQFLFGTGLRIWNRAGTGDKWGTPVMQFPPFVLGVPKRIVCLFSRTANSLTYRGVAIDDVFTPLNTTFSAVPEAQNAYLNNAVQVDSKGQGASITVLLNECNVGVF